MGQGWSCAYERSSISLKDISLTDTRRMGFWCEIGFRSGHYAVYSLARRSQQVMRLLCGYVAATFFLTVTVINPA